MKNVSIAVVTVLVALTASAAAGRKDNWPVVVDLINKNAYGSLASARNSPDTVQNIGCSVFYDTVNRRNQVSCTATNAAGTTAQCGSQDPNLVQVGTAIGSDSFVQFRWDAAGACTTIFVSNSSTLGPKAP
jgi:hypothetical protein